MTPKNEREPYGGDPLPSMAMEETAEPESVDVAPHDDQRLVHASGSPMRATKTDLDRLRESNKRAEPTSPSVGAQEPCSEQDALDWLKVFCGLHENGVVGDSIDVVMSHKEGEVGFWIVDVYGTKRRFKEVLAAFANHRAALAPTQPQQCRPKLRRALSVVMDEVRELCPKCAATVDDGPCSRHWRMANELEKAMAAEPRAGRDLEGSK